MIKFEVFLRRIVGLTVVLSGIFYSCKAGGSGSSCFTGLSSSTQNVTKASDVKTIIENLFTKFDSIISNYGNTNTTVQLVDSFLQCEKINSEIIFLLANCAKDTISGYPDLFRQHNLYENQQASAEIKQAISEYFKFFDTHPVVSGTPIQAIPMAENRAKWQSTTAIWQAGIYIGILYSLKKRNFIN